MDSKLKKTESWKGFLSNEKNKKTLVKLLRESWSNDLLAKELHGRQVILIHEHEDMSAMSEASKFTSADGTITMQEKIQP